MSDILLSAHQFLTVKKITQAHSRSYLNLRVCNRAREPPTGLKCKKKKISVVKNYVTTLRLLRPLFFLVGHDMILKNTLKLLRFNNQRGYTKESQLLQ